MPERNTVEKERGGGFSFEALMEEDGEIPYQGARGPVSAGASAREPSRSSKGTSFLDLVDDLPDEHGALVRDSSSSDSDSEDEAEFDAEEMENRLNARVLGSSGYRQKPYWWNSLIVAIAAQASLRVAVVMNAPAALSYVVMLLAGAGVFFAGHGLSKTRDRKGRMLCYVALLMALGAGYGAFSAW